MIRSFNRVTKVYSPEHRNGRRLKARMIPKEAIEKAIAAGWETDCAVNLEKLVVDEFGVWFNGVDGSPECYLFTAHIAQDRRFWESLEKWKREQGMADNGWLPLAHRYFETMLLDRDPVQFWENTLRMPMAKVRRAN